MTSMTARRRTRALVAFAAVASITAAVLVAGPGYDTPLMRMFSGAIWLASTQTGKATLVDGATAEVTASVQVAERGTALSIVHQGDSAYVLNQRTGQLRRLDSATEQVSPPVSVLPPSDGLSVKPALGALYAVDIHNGTIAAADLGTLAPKGEPQRLAGAIRPGSVAVDGQDRLWAVDDETGDLVWLAGGERHKSSAAIRNGLLTITGDQPAVVDPRRGTVELLHPETGAVVERARVDLHEDDVVAVTGSAGRSRVLIANSTRGELTTCTFGEAGCTGPVRISDAGADLGNPVELDDHAVIPDYSTGKATVVDLATSQVVAQREIFTRPTRFELIAHGDTVFFNDPNGDVAGVLDLTGDVRTITKYAEGPAEADLQPPVNRTAQPDQVPKAERHEQKTGLGIPRDTVRPDSGNRPPEPPSAAASIEVRPGTHNVVGQESELTMVLRSPAGEWSTRWWLDDGTERSGTTVRHVWTRPGVFTVRATATFATGARVLAETTVTVVPQEAPLGITALHVRRPKPVVGESVHFSADITGRPDRWSWIITRPGGATPEPAVQTPEFDRSFDAPGIYTVTLVLTKGPSTTRSTRRITIARGAVKAWGMNVGGRLDVPPAAGSGVIAIATGSIHVLALKADGSVISWGDEGRAQDAVPSQATSGVVAIAAGGNHSLALKADGSVIAWGRNDNGQTSVPPLALHDVIAIAAGLVHSLALRKDGSVIAWGGDPMYGQATVPPEALSGVTAIAAGSNHSIALKSDGSVLFWGIVRPEAPRVPPGATSGVVAIAAGRYISMAVKSDGSVIAWGWSKEGMIPAPEKAMNGVVSVSVNTHALALKTDGSLISWGQSRGGSDVPPEYSTGVLAAAAGGHYSLVLI